MWTVLEAEEWELLMVVLAIAISVALTAAVLT